jgi:PAS domain-containing protein
MTDRVDLFEAAIDSLPEGLALLHGDSDGPFEVMFWNQAAVAITGHTAVDLVGRALPDNLGPLLGEAPSHDETTADPSVHPGRGFLARVRHKLGHEVSFAIWFFAMASDSESVRAYSSIRPTSSMLCLAASQAKVNRSIQARQSSKIDSRT